MKAGNCNHSMKMGKIIFLLLLICLAIPQGSNAGEKGSPATEIQVPYDYKDYDAIISGTASKLENGTRILVKGRFTNNYWDGFCDINVYLTTITKDGGKTGSKRFYLGDLLEGESDKYELAVDCSPEIKNLELTFIYEICSTRHETPADFITITIPWAPK